MGWFFSDYRVRNEQNEVLTPPTTTPTQLICEEQPPTTTTTPILPQFGGEIGVKLGYFAPNFGKLTPTIQHQPNFWQK